MRRNERCEVEAFVLATLLIVLVVVVIVTAVIAAGVINVNL